MRMTSGEIFEAYTADYGSLVHYAQRSDGQWFTRVQSRDPIFGYKWSRWRKTVAPSRHLSSTARKARLPKD